MRAFGPLRVFSRVAMLLVCLGCSGGDEDSDDDDDDNGSTGNVDFSLECAAPSGCGGDPTGTWDVVGGCVQPSGSDYNCDWELTARGTVSGTAEFGAGSYSLETDAELRHCGWVDGSGRSSGGTYTIQTNTIVLGTRGLVFCVEGDTLWLWDMAATHPDFSVLELERSSGGGSG